MYRLIGFGVVSLEHYDPIDDVGSGVTPSAYQALLDGGAMDLFGGQQKHPGTVERTKTITIYEDQASDANDLFFQLLALRGRRDRLYRRTIAGDTHWMYARLVEVSAKRKGLYQVMDLRFVTQEAFWRGTLTGAWYLDAGEYFDGGLYLDGDPQVFPLTGSPITFTLSIGTATGAGRAPSRALRITISAGDADMSNITVTHANGQSFHFGGTITANTDLVIDTGTMQVHNDGVDAYDGLTISSTADLAAWFTLKPGDNPITVSFAFGGIGPQIAFEYYEGWY